MDWGDEIAGYVAWASGPGRKSVSSLPQKALSRLRKPGDGATCMRHPVRGEDLPERGRA